MVRLLLAPTSVLGSYPMAQVDLGPYNEEAHACNVKDDCAHQKCLAIQQRSF